MIEREQIAATYQRILPYIRRTPVIETAAAAFGITASTVTFKLEFMQHAGSFKTRGAFANLLLREIPKPGVVAASGGNHGAAVAYAAGRRGVPATIFVPTVASPAKIARIRECGAELVITGERYADALAASRLWQAKSGALPIHAFDQEETLLGQGTLALEFEEQAPKLETLLVAVGGGGLIGGVAAWHAGKTRIVAVEPEGAPTLDHAWKAGAPVDAPAGSIAADSLAPARIGELPFALIRKFVERVVLVSDDDIRRAQRALWDQLRIVVEPGGAAAFAALLSGKYQPSEGERVGVVLSGGNTTLENW